MTENCLEWMAAIMDSTARSKTRGSRVTITLQQGQQCSCILLIAMVWAIFNPTLPTRYGMSPYFCGVRSVAKNGSFLTNERDDGKKWGL
ncbi:hypothetical protein BDV29DRAFT_120271 [Aspergillus leporis]|uniref:Uncharacterized protein n=1 Tax=Aspergillus leporis TaxID=41062 RepID=A0A5N5XDP5_9EURO|nr:hypothetical protein BDV29DRAFT_120271 [Aspergillus leporis]